MPAIDIHFHVVPPLFVEAVHNGEFREVIEIAVIGDTEHLVFQAPPGIPVEPNTELEPGTYDPALIMAALDERKLTAAAMSPAPELFIYWAPADLGARLARTINDGMLDLATKCPGRLVGLATLPLPDAEASARELKRAVRLGMRGAALCTHINGHDLDASHLEPVFQMAQDLDVPLFLHPQNSGDLARMKDYHLWNMVGFPFETALAATRLIMSGTFERFPNLKVVLAHGGGYFPYQIGRLDHGYRRRHHLRDGLPHPPSHYLKNIFCDGLIHDQQSLRFLIDRMGADHVVLGCDYPFDMGTSLGVQSLKSLGLSKAQEDAVLGATLARLLKLEQPALV
jgi:aminocarboxymuconate-semialdehyde decarboxylase